MYYIRELYRFLARKHSGFKEMFNALAAIGEDMHYLQEEFGLDGVDREHAAQSEIFKEYKLFEPLYMARMAHYASQNPLVPRECLETPVDTTPDEQLDIFMPRIRAILEEIDKKAGAERNDAGLKSLFTELRNCVIGVIRIHELALPGTALKKRAHNCIMDLADLFEGGEVSEMMLWDTWLLFMYLVPG